MRVPSCYQDFVNQAWEILGKLEDMNWVAENDKIAAAIAPLIPMDTRKPYTDADVAMAQQQMRYFVTGRRAYLSRSCRGHQPVGRNPIPSPVCGRGLGTDGGARHARGIKARVGKDHVQIRTADDPAATAALAGRRHHRRRARRRADVRGRLGRAVRAAPVRRAGRADPIDQRVPAVSDDVFMSFTGSTIRDAEATATDQMRAVSGAIRGRRGS